MKTPSISAEGFNGKYLSIRTDGWQQIFDSIIFDFVGPVSLHSIVAPMISKLEIPENEVGAVEPYAQLWVREAIKRAGFEMRRGRMGGIFRTKD